MQVDTVADGVERQLDPRVIPLQRVVGWIVDAVLSLASLVALVIALFASDLPGWALALLGLLWIAGTVLLAWWTYRWAELEYRHSAYRVDADGIEIRKGVWWRKVIDVPKSRVQHTDVSQGPLERRFELGTLVIYTAGTDYAMVDLHGLDHSTALRIRDHLLPREGSDAV